MKSVYLVILLALPSILIASTKAEETGNNKLANALAQHRADEALLKINCYLAEIKKMQEIVNGHLEAPDVKRDYNKNIHTLRADILKSLDDGITNSERPFDVLRETKSAAINPETKTALKTIEQWLWFWYGLKVAGIVAAGTIIVGGVVALRK
jgi:hypothetical protein